MNYRKYLVKKTFYIGEIRREIVTGSIIEFDGTHLKVAEVTYKAPKFEGAIRAGWAVLTDDTAVELVSKPQKPKKMERKMRVHNVESTLGEVFQKKINLEGTNSFNQKQAVKELFGEDVETKHMNLDEYTQVYIPKKNKEQEETKVIKKKGRPKKEKPAKLGGCVEVDDLEDLAEIYPDQFEVTKTPKRRGRPKKSEQVQEESEINKDEIQNQNETDEEVILEGKKKRGRPKKSEQDIKKDKLITKDDLTEDELKTIEEWFSLKHWAKKKGFIENLNTLKVLKYLYDRETPGLKKLIRDRMDNLQE